MGVVIKAVLMLGIAGAALVLLRGYAGARHQAIRRLLLVAFMAAAAASLVVPQLWTEAAALLGVGRGTDLLLYLTILAFLGFVATSYLRFRDMQRQITALTRRLALDEALPPRAPLRPVVASAGDGARSAAPTPETSSTEREAAPRSMPPRGRRSSESSMPLQHAAHR